MSQLPTSKIKITACTGLYMCGAMTLALGFFITFGISFIIFLFSLEFGKIAGPSIWGAALMLTGIVLYLIGVKLKYSLFPELNKKQRKDVCSLSVGFAILYCIIVAIFNIIGFAIFI